MTNMTPTEVKNFLLAHHSSVEAKALGNGNWSLWLGPKRRDNRLIRVSRRSPTSQTELKLAQSKRMFPGSISEEVLPGVLKTEMERLEPGAYEAGSAATADTKRSTATSERDLVQAALRADIDEDPRFKNVDAKTRTALVEARVGQGAYRQQMLKRWGGQCAVSTCAIATVLIASHAKPWRYCTVDECRDEFNGLPLAASIDRLFDQGLIAFDDKGKMLIKSAVISWEQIEALGVPQSRKLRMVLPKNVAYLKEHRRIYGFPDGTM